MDNPVRILGIAGSLRHESYNRAALRAATQLAPEDAVIEIFELDGIPGFSQDEEQNPPAKVAELDLSTSRSLNCLPRQSSPYSWLSSLPAG